jgi:predicted Zn finger-like uncharacterized protein
MPIKVTCSACQAKFQVKDEFAGRKVRCSQCKAVIELPDEDDEVEDYDDDSGLDPAFQRDKFLLHQKHFSINTRYTVCDESGEDIMHVVRPSYLFRNLLAIFATIFVLIFLIIAVVTGMLFLQPVIGEVGVVVLGIVGLLLMIVAAVTVWTVIAPKRHITFFADAKHEQKLLEVLQDQKLALRMATFTVRDENGEEIGLFRKDYFANFLRKRWDGFDPDGNHLYVIREDSIILSLLRRFLGTFYGLLRTNFVIHEVDEDGTDGALLGEFNRKFTLMDRYVLDLTPDRTRVLDRRMAIAIGVLLDTAESR